MRWNKSWAEFSLSRTSFSSRDEGATMMRRTSRAFDGLVSADRSHIHHGATATPCGRVGIRRSRSLIGREDHSIQPSTFAFYRRRPSRPGKTSPQGKFHLRIYSASHFRFRLRYAALRSSERP